MNALRSIPDSMQRDRKRRLGAKRADCRSACIAVQALSPLIWRVADSSSPSRRRRAAEEDDVDERRQRRHRKLGFSVNWRMPKTIIWERTDEAELGTANVRI